MRRFARVLVPAAIALASTAASCSATDKPAPAPAFRENVAGLLQAKCVECHSGDAPAGGWSAASYMDVIGCVASDGTGATLPRANGVTPILSALAERSHNEGLPIVKRLTDAERDVVTRWIAAGAPAWRSAIHPIGFVDPRSQAHHSKFLRARKWQPMLDAKYAVGTPDSNGVVDPDDPGPCGQCHGGLSDAATPGSPDPSNPSLPARAFAPGATACTGCHDKPGGVLNCTTCHGNGDKPYAVRDVCFHPAAQRGPNEATPDRQRNHEGHVLSGSQFMNQTLQCNACHNVPGGADVLNGIHGGTHGNGQIDVILAAGVAGVGASWDPTTKACTNRCHNATPSMKDAKKDAQRPTPSFDDTAKIKCGDCHGAPPSQPGGTGPDGVAYDHYRSPDGTCTFCHKEIGGTYAAPSLNHPFSMHLDGKIEKGDGSGQCNACHGNTGVKAPNDSPAPSSGAHPAHFNPKFRKDPIPCNVCHVVPSLTDKHPVGDTGHGHVTFSGLAVNGGFAAKPYAPGGTCTVYCHSAIPGGANSNPKWVAGSPGGQCGDCHGVPPPNHFQGTCGVGTCHVGIIAPASNPPVFTDAGKALHINGAVNPGLP